MATAREMRLRIRSVKNISQVTRALETVSASHVRKAMQAFEATKPYAEKAWKVLIHLARQPGGANLHPLLNERSTANKVLVLLLTSDRGLAGAYNVNILRYVLDTFKNFESPVHYVAVGKKGRDMLARRRRNLLAEFSNLPIAPSFMNVSQIGFLAVEEFLDHGFDQVYIAFTEYKSMVRQEPIIRKLLPMDVESTEEGHEGYNVTHHKTNAVFSYEPDQEKLLSEIVPRFTALQVYRCILSAQASEHAARMISMRNATDNAHELVQNLQIEYNKARQQAITNDMLDIAGGAEAQIKAG
jgi:F-type H+-transporting ATPase subunit gamma